MSDSLPVVIDSDWVLSLFNSLQTANRDNPVVVFKPDKTEDFKVENENVCFFRVNQVGFDEEYPRRESFTNVIRVLDDPGFNFVYVLSGDRYGVSLYIGVVKNSKTSKRPNFSAISYIETIAKTFQANFNGSRLTRLFFTEGKEGINGKDNLTSFLNGKKEFKYAGMILGIPSTDNEGDGGKQKGFQNIDRLIDGMHGTNWRLTVVCEPVSPEEINGEHNKVIELYQRLQAVEKVSYQIAHSNSANMSGETIFSQMEANMTGKTDTTALDIVHASRNGRKQQNQTASSANTNQNTLTNNWQLNTGFSWGANESYSGTVEIVNKGSMMLTKYLEDKILNRYQAGPSNGLFKTSVYYMTEKPVDVNRIKACLVSQFQGDKGNQCPLICKELELNALAKKMLFAGQNLDINDEIYSDFGVLFARPESELRTFLTPQEVSVIAGLPTKEVPGIPLSEFVSFGLNVFPAPQSSSKNAIQLGNMVFKDSMIEGPPFILDKDSLKKHVFVAGVTGSGKTTTCLKLLSNAGLPFLVIEPAKTEYRILLRQKQFKDVIVFTLGNESVAPFRLNPFELFKGENISGHVDMIKATFTSAFPMEASMPQILEEAIYACYEDKGWDISTNENNSGKEEFPTVSDLLRKMKDVVREKGFGERLQAEYEGSLVSRLSHLTIGSKGMMLNCARSVDFEFLMTNKVILEMDEINAPDEKALLMGFVLSRLSAYIKMKHGSDIGFRHITLVEEAHRLLAKNNYADNARKNAVAAFSDMLAEVRKYGESLVIADQSPDKLVSDVLKNTSTKIIHKLFDRVDREAIGDTMLMDDDQKKYLSSLDIGHAIVFSEQTPKPVHVMVTADSAIDTSLKTPDNEMVKKRFDEMRGKMGVSFLTINLLVDRFYDSIKKTLCPHMCLSGLEKYRKDVAEEMNGLDAGVSNPNGFWKKFFQRFYQEKGYYRTNSPDEMEKHIDLMTGIFSKETSITDEDAITIKISTRSK